MKTTTEPIYTPERLQLWTYPANYMGETWYGHYSAGVGQHRDSDCLERANFDSMIAALDNLPDLPGEEDDIPAYTIVRENHWAVGWVEWIAVPQVSYRALRIADEIRTALDDYGIIDETRFSDYEWKEAAETWGILSIAERVELCREWGDSIFAARRDALPENAESGRLVQ